VKNMLENSADKKRQEMGFTRTQMQKDMVLRLLKERGCRITKQRQILLDVILQEDCTCCKEIYYKASKRDPKIGSATVYRMVNVLEEIGAINRGNMFKLSWDGYIL
jgi:Fur family ferric uptake transcriptional regulator